MTPKTPIPIDFRRIRTVGDVLNHTFLFLRQNMERLGKSLLFYLAPVAAVVSIFNTVTTSSLANADAVLGINMDVLLLIFFTVMMAFSVAATVICGYMILYQDRGPDGFALFDVWRLLRARFLRIFGTMLFLLFLAFVGYLVSIIPTGLLFSMALAFAGTTRIPVFLMSFLVVLGYLSFLTYFVVTLSLMIPMRMREPVGVWAATVRCFRLIKNNWWASFGVFFVSMLLYSMLSTVFGIPLFILSLWSEIHAVDGGSTLYTGLVTVAGVVAAVGGALFYSIPLTAMALQYFNLVERKELKGLRQRVEAIKPGPDAAAAPDDPALEPRARVAA